MNNSVRKYVAIPAPSTTLIPHRRQKLTLLDFIIRGTPLTEVVSRKVFTGWASRDFFWADSVGDAMSLGSAGGDMVSDYN